MKLAKFIASISLVLTVASVSAALAQQTPGAQLAAPNADACDRLAASPYDEARANGIQDVPFEQVDAPAAIEACRAALANRPDDVRMSFQLARALQKDGGAEALTEAVHLYRFAADQGHVVAQYNLGVFYANGRGGVPKNDEEAARLYKLAADQGVSIAQVDLGHLYEGGRGGLPKDEQEAARLYKLATLAADQGVASGQANLGRLYETGRGGLPKDEQEAARLYRLAAGSCG
jgi:TPR repeat protein